MRHSAASSSSGPIAGPSSSPWSPRSDAPGRRLRRSGETGPGAVPDDGGLARDNRPRRTRRGVPTRGTFESAELSACATQNEAFNLIGDEARVYNLSGDDKAVNGHDVAHQDAFGELTETVEVAIGRLVSQESRVDDRGWKLGRPNAESILVTPPRTASISSRGWARATTAASVTNRWVNTMLRGGRSVTISRSRPVHSAP